MKYYRLSGITKAVFLIISVSFVISGASARPIGRGGQTTLSVEAYTTVLTLEVLRHDPDLNRVVALRFDEARLDDVFKVLADQHNLKLTVISDLAPRRITARCKYAPVASFMIALSRVLGVSWRKSGDRYNLFQTAEQIKSEAWKRRASEAKEQRYVEAQGNTLRTQVQGALSQKGLNRDIFADFLMGYDANTIDKGIASALEDEPILSAVDQSHFHNHFFAAAPFSTLFPAQQESVQQIARESGYYHLSAESSVGLIAAAGGFRLGIVEPDGKDLWVAPQHSVGQVSTVSQTVREDDFDPKVVEQLRSSRLVEFGTLAETLRRKRLKSESGIDRSRLAVLLQEIAAQTDFDFLCDCYLNSAQTTHIYNPDPTWMADVALTWIARTFAHKMTYHGGLLEVATVTAGLDLRLEAPPAVMNSLDAQALSGRLPNRADLLVLSVCNQEQLQVLAQRHLVIRKTRTGHILQALRSYPFLHFYGSLSTEQQTRALAVNGVNVRDLSVSQHRLFDALFTIGLPKTAPTKYKLEKNRFYLKFNAITLHNGMRRDVITFIATTPENALFCRTAGL